MTKIISNALLLISAAILIVTGMNFLPSEVNAYKPDRTIYKYIRINPGETGRVYNTPRCPEGYSAINALIPRSMPGVPARDSHRPSTEFTMLRRYKRMIKIRVYRDYHQSFKKDVMKLKVRCADTRKLAQNSDINQVNNVYVVTKNDFEHLTA